MTCKEAIEILKPLTGYTIDENGICTFPMVSALSQAEALELAISALKCVDMFIDYLGGEEI